MSAIDELKGKSVLIVDDDEDLAETIKEQLESIGLNVVGVAYDADSALSLVEETDPSLVILDIQLPGMDGIELADRINAMEPRPVLFLSAYSDSEYIVRARESGVLTYLVKPVSAENMIPSIILTMDRFREMVSLKATVDDMKENMANTELIERAKEMLAAEKGISLEEAFEDLRTTTRTRNKPLADVARSIVDRENT